MTTQFLNRISGAALVLAGIVWSVGIPVASLAGNDSPLNLAGVLAVCVAAPLIMLIGFGGVWLLARRTKRLGLVGEAGYGSAVLGSLVLPATTLNLLNGGDPAWYTFWGGLILFIAGLGISGAMITILGMVPRWSTLPLVAVAAVFAAAMIAATPPLNLLNPSSSVSSFLFEAFVVALGAGLILLGGAFLVIPRRYTLPQALEPSAAS